MRDRGQLLLKVRRLHGRAARLDRRAKGARLGRRLLRRRRFQPHHVHRLQRRLERGAVGRDGVPRQGRARRDPGAHRLLHGERGDAAADDARHRPQGARRDGRAVRLCRPRGQALVGHVLQDSRGGAGGDHPRRRLRPRRRGFPPPLRICAARGVRGGVHASAHGDEARRGARCVSVACGEGRPPTASPGDSVPATAAAREDEPDGGPIGTPRGRSKVR
mmetsp:Transcript_16014/g.51361  ORF Transcript_16014/g.51361 Transcript_16014/m.51361 type:complete len:219 (-) Transcript_16014:22-678(-)